MGFSNPKPAKGKNEIFLINFGESSINFGGKNSNTKIYFSGNLVLISGENSNTKKIFFGEFSINFEKMKSAAQSLMQEINTRFPEK